ncbi:MAG: hypothetical protein VZR75_03415, partial [Candidatus Enteromonas sp.]|nr:hypothetical protein [Candidatus Enteromonas sp.]
MGLDELVHVLEAHRVDIDVWILSLDEIVGSDNADEIYEKKVLKKKNTLRIKYAETVSFKTDFYLFFNTIWRVI